MKYRPLGSTGAAVSSLCLCIGPADLARGQKALKQQIITGLEAGINAYHFEVTDPAFLQAAGEALGHVERALIWVSLSLGEPKRPGQETRQFASEHLSKTVEDALHNSGLGWFDVAVLNEPAENELPLSTLSALKALRSSGQVRMLGIKGEAAVMDTYISTGAFDALYTPSSINNSAHLHSRMREAQKRDLVIFVYDYDRDLHTKKKTSSVTSTPKKGLLGWLGVKDRPVDETPATNFSFLNSTPGWSGEEICLSLALTDPAVSSVLIRPASPDAIQPLAQAVERHLPSRLAAQIEMARFA